MDWLQGSRVAWVILAALAVVMQGVWLLDALADLRATGLSEFYRALGYPEDLALDAAALELVTLGLTGGSVLLTLAYLAGIRKHFR